MNSLHLNRLLPGATPWTYAPCDENAIAAAPRTVAHYRAMYFDECIDRDFGPLEQYAGD